MYQEISEKMSSGDNQQETLTRNTPFYLGYFLSGFTEGEGSFIVSIRKHPDYRIKWKTSLTFNVSQKGDKILLLFKKVLKCGHVRHRRDGICYFEVVDFKDIIFKVIPFFQKFPLMSEKAKDFKIFIKVANLMADKEHLNKNGLKKILKLRKPMNKGGKNRRLDIKKILKEI